MTLVRVTLPVLLTVPEKVNTPPGRTAVAGQCLTNHSPGAVTTAHEFVIEVRTFAPEQPLLARTVRIEVLMVWQESIGGTYLATKFAVSPLAKLIGPNTGVLFEGWF